MNETYGLVHLWAQGDWVIRGVTVLLVAMSIASWTVMLGKGVALWRQNRAQPALRRQFWRTPAALRSAWLNDAPAHPLVNLATRAIEANSRYRTMADDATAPVNRDEWMNRSLQAALEAESAESQHGLPLVASVSSTTPFIGLFGTVWGIYHALQAIGQSGQASLDHVAGPVGEALAMTALGLAVAIPASFGYNLLVRFGRSQMADLRQFGRALHTSLVMGIEPAAESLPRSATMAPAQGQAS